MQLVLWPQCYRMEMKLMSSELLKTPCIIGVVDLKSEVIIIHLYIKNQTLREYVMFFKLKINLYDKYKSEWISAWLIVRKADLEEVYNQPSILSLIQECLWSRRAFLHLCLHCSKFKGAHSAATQRHNRDHLNSLCRMARNGLELVFYKKNTMLPTKNLSKRNTFFHFRKNHNWFNSFRLFF